LDQRNFYENELDKLRDDLKDLKDAEAQLLEMQQRGE